MKILLKALKGMGDKVFGGGDVIDDGSYRQRDDEVCEIYCPIHHLMEDAYMNRWLHRSIAPASLADYESWMLFRGNSSGTIF